MIVVRRVRGSAGGYRNGKAQLLRMLPNLGTVILDGTRGAASQLAHRVLGAGNYRTKTTPEGIEIQRSDAVLHPLHCEGCGSLVGRAMRPKLSCYCVECRP